ncbi:hypothetical protein [Roseimaritima sediminicola]|uniref:hypothetical protein n=1 Tax=Roseimaritima sediminicola TaxID=2662066 RepID=UPI0012982AD4|nr:hypothetical protein [Roseimaritima sediminicola]
MAVRLPVLLSQSPDGSSRQQQRQTETVMGLLGVAGLDVSLIGPLGRDTLSDTDRLVLESQERDFALVSALPPEQAIDVLTSLGISGRRAAHRLDPQADPGTGRKIFCLDWSAAGTGDALLRALEQILAEQQTVTIPLQLAPPQRAAATGSATTGSDSQPAARRRPEARPAAAEVAPPSRPGSASASDDSLDALVQDLNDLDL